MSEVMSGTSAMKMRHASRTAMESHPVAELQNLGLNSTAAKKSVAKIDCLGDLGATSTRLTFSCSM